jgi:hypothetical protein
MTRIHILLPEADKARFAQQAAREGKSLGAWLREAAEEKFATAADARSFARVEDLHCFFADRDRLEQAPEPDWEEHLQVMDQSRGGGLAG